VTKAEAFTGKKVDLKKQSQFVPGLMGVTPFAKGDYGDISVAGIEENKANQSQFQAPTQQKGTVKREKLPPATKSLAG
jgi:hypothetical protein